MSQVTNNIARSRFELVENGEMAFATYQDMNGALSIPHVETAIPLRGNGAAGRLMAGVVDYARANNVKIVPICPYAVAWFRRNPTAADVLQ
jgi:predicted GNAT family acetyltransferase